VRNREVCICGHPITAHSSGVMYQGELKRRCQTGKLECGCKRPTPVLRASNLRVFQKRSTGNSGMHALMLAIDVCLKTEPPIEIDWIEEPYCWNCGDVESPVQVCRLLHPLRVMELGGKLLENVDSEKAEENGFLCRECRELDQNINLWKFSKNSGEDLPNDNPHDNVVHIR